jgi:hypothetical protein
MHLAPEFHLFCRALRRPQGVEDAEALQEALAAAPDWAAIVAGARRHRVAPLLHAALKDFDPAQVPAEIVAELRRQTSFAAARSLAQVAEIGRLFRAFADAGLRVLALKGVVLSTQLYGDSTLRNARDIDLLAHPNDFARVDAILAAAGYRSSNETLSPRQKASYRHWLKDVEYVRARDGMALELHQRLTDNENLLACDFGALWREREEVRLGDAAVPTLSRDALALYLCVHGAGHGWERLRWLVDLASLLREPRSVDLALAAADAAGLGAAMLHALMLAHDWLGLAVADAHLARALANPQVRRLDRILSHLYAGEAWHEIPRRGSRRGLARYSVWQRLYRIALKPDWRYRVSQAMRECFTPADWSTIRLPDALFFLYPLVRPVGWLMRRWQR